MMQHVRKVIWNYLFNLFMTFGNLFLSYTDGCEKSHRTIGGILGELGSTMSTLSRGTKFLLKGEYKYARVLQQHTELS